MHRLSADAHMLAGNYEQETAIMLIEAFKKAEDARGYIAKGEAQDVVKNICAEHGIAYDETDRWKEANNSAYKFGHAFVG